MKPIGVLWHEPIKGRSAKDVASTFTFFICNFRDCKICFLDGQLFWSEQELVSLHSSCQRG